MRIDAAIVLVIATSAGAWGQVGLSGAPAAPERGATARGQAIEWSVTFEDDPVGEACRGASAWWVSWGRAWRVIEGGIQGKSLRSVSSPVACPVPLNGARYQGTQLVSPPRPGGFGRLGVDMLISSASDSLTIGASSELVGSTVISAAIQLTTSGGVNVAARIDGAVQYIPTTETWTIGEVTRWTFELDANGQLRCFKGDSETPFYIGSDLQPGYNGGHTYGLDQVRITLQSVTTNGAVTIDNLSFQGVAGPVQPPALPLLEHVRIQPPIGQSGLEILDLGVGDVSGDGAPDVLALVQQFDNSVIYAALLTSSTPWETCSPGSSWPLAFALGDFTGDGSQREAAFLSFCYVSVCTGVNSANFSTDLCSEFPSISNESGSTKAADLDGDGRLDLVVANFVSGDVHFLRNDGTARFSHFLQNGELAIVPSGFGRAWELAIGDVNGDGRPDVVGTGRPAGANTARGFFVMLNLPTQSGIEIATEVVHWSEPRRPALALFDLEQDGDLDIAFESARPDRVLVFINNGDGAFQPGPEFDARYAVNDIAATDIDRDGDTDLVLAHYCNASITVLRNRQGHLLLSNVNHLGAPVGRVVVDDFDADGWPDVAVGMTGLYNREGVQFLALLQRPDPCPADLDGDGFVGSPDLALLLGSWGSVAFESDVNGDTLVDSEDLALMLGAWGPCP